MKKLLLAIILFVPLLSIAQLGVYEYKPDTAIITQRVYPFIKINGSATDYELPYLRYCFKKCSNFRTATYVLAGFSSAIALLPVFYTEEKYPKIDWNKFQKACVISSLTVGASGIVTLIISEKWFKKSSIKPALSPDGIGITLTL